MMQAFPARYVGICDDCEGPIVPGELIQYNEDKRVVHNSCVTRERAAIICPLCFLQRPCEHDGLEFPKL